MGPVLQLPSVAAAGMAATKEAEMAATAARTAVARENILRMLEKVREVKV